MVRAPIQIIVIPCRRRTDREWEFAVFHRTDEDVWQFIAGGVEEGESPKEAAQREAYEEAGVPQNLAFRKLDSVASIPRHAFPQASHWSRKLYVVPEYSFAVDVGSEILALSCEHRDLQWVRYEEALHLLNWDSNCTALWELHERLRQDT